eukprot:scaffold57319_cov38-Prasinocladus_malaysianus.AAC.2
MYHAKTAPDIQPKQVAFIIGRREYFGACQPHSYRTFTCVALWDIAASSVDDAKLNDDEPETYSTCTGRTIGFNRQT